MAAVAQGTGATTSDAHYFGLQIDGLDVLKEAGSPGSLFGTEIDSVVLTDAFPEVPSLEWIVDDPGAELSPAKGANVYFVDHRGIRDTGGNYSANDLFRGILVSARKVEDGAVNVRWRMYALGLSTLLDRNVLVEGVIPAGTVPAAAIQQVCSTLDPRISALRDVANALGVSPVGGVNNLIGGGSTGIVAAVPLAGKTYRKALADIVAAAQQWPWAGAYQGQDILDITAQGRVRWDPQVAYVQHGASGYAENTNVTTYPVAPYDVDPDERNLMDAYGRVYVRGVDALSSGWVTLDETPVVPGMASGYLEAPECTSSAQRDGIGQAWLRKHLPGTKGTFTISGSHADVHATAPLVGYQGYGARQWAVWSSRFYSAGVQDLVIKMVRTWDGGGTVSTIRMTTTPSSANGGFSIGGSTTGIQQTITAADDRSRAAGRLVGTLDEVAIRSKAGVPTDADFDVPRDGFIVLDTTSDVLWSRSNGAWVPQRGYEYAYNEFTAPVSVVATTEATANTIVTASTFTADGSAVLIEFGSDYHNPPTDVVVRLWLYEDGSSIGEIGVLRLTQASTPIVTNYYRRRHTPSPGPRTYSIRGSTASGTYTIDAGAGGAGLPMPGWIRITKA